LEDDSEQRQFDPIQADGGSNNDLIRRNTATGNQFDLVNLGQNNCFRHNHYVTHGGTIGC
jgi:hypothetical protein